MLLSPYQNAPLTFERLSRTGECDVGGPALLDDLLRGERGLEPAHVAVERRQNLRVPPQLEVEGLAALRRVLRDRRVGQVAVGDAGTKT
jgi:hypothetical protein